MTIIEAINKIDALKPNSYTQSEKVAWLSTLDGMTKRMIDQHEGEEVKFDGYTNETPTNTVMLIPAPYDEAYILWLESKIDYTNGEYNKYNNSITRFNDTFTAYNNDYNRTHMPKGKKIKYF